MHPVQKLVIDRSGQRLHALLLILGFAFFVGALVVSAVSDHWFISMTLGVSSVALMIGTIPVTLADLGLRPRSEPRPVESATDIGEIKLDRSAFHLSSDQSSYLANSVTNPSAVISRIHERVEPKTRALQFEVSMHVRRVPISKGVTYLPVHIMRKGRMVDDLRVIGQDGVELPLLAFGDTVSLAMATIHALVAAVGGEQAQIYEEKLEKRVLRIVARRAPITPEERRKLDRLSNDLEKLLGDSELADTIRLLIGILAKHYVHVAALPTVDTSNTGPYALAVRFRRIHDMGRSHGWHSAAALLGRVRTTLGVRPSTYTLSIENASRSASYHLEFMGPPHTFLARQLVAGWRLEKKSDDELELKQIPFQTGIHGKYRRNRRRRGQRYAHFYVRGGRRRVIKDHMTASFTFFERMPGSVGEAAVVSYATTALIAGGGWVISQSTPANGDLMAVLLAFPIIASSWLGLQREQTVAGGVLVSRLGSLITALIAAAGALGAFGLALPDFELASRFSFMGVEGGWCLLLLATLANSFALTTSWGRRSIVYAEIIERDDDGENFYAA